MIDPKETLRICGEYAAEVADVPNLETRFDVYAREALPEYAAWVQDAMAALEDCLLPVETENFDDLAVKIKELLARVKHD